MVQSPGNLNAKIWDGSPRTVMAVLRRLNRPAVMGACTALWTGLSEEVIAEDGRGMLSLGNAGILIQGGCCEWV